MNGLPNNERTNYSAESIFCAADEFAVTTKPGEPYRLFPFGKLVKGGTAHEITPEYAARFRLPHFKPPIKLGSHDERCPAGGQIVGLEVRQDGLYAIPEYTEQGTTSLDRGDYRYHSPEVIWDTGALEDPTTGNLIDGPFIVGDALLHTPHLGEAAALYSFEVNPKQEVTLMAEQEEMVSVPKNIFERFAAWLDRKTAEPEPPATVVEPAKTEPPAPPAPTVELDKFTALQAERDNLEAERKAAVEKLAAIEAEKAHTDMVAGIVAQLQDKEKFSSMYVELREAEEAAGMLSGMTPEQRDWCLRKFSADAAKINLAALYTEKGSDGKGAADSANPIDAAVRATMEEKKVSYVDAFNMVRASRPELFTVTK